MANDSSTILTLQDFRFAYGRDEVVKGVSMEVAHREFVTIIGPNGAGKSTILRNVMRILDGYGGTIEVDGKDLHTYHQRDLAKVISYVPQSVRGSLPWTVEEFVLMGRYPYLGAFQSRTPDDDRVLQNALELTNMKGFEKREMMSLSGGERQTVMVAAAIAQEADLLLLDEPATFLDPKHQDNVNHLMHRLTNQEGKAILAVTHDVNAAAMHSDRVIALKDGVIAFAGPPTELMDEAVLERIFDKTFTLVDHPSTGGRVIVPEAAS